MRQKDLDQFLDYTRLGKATAFNIERVCNPLFHRIKFVGFTLENDRTTLAGLPQPIHEGVDVLRKHMYKSLAEVQIEVSEE